VHQSADDRYLWIPVSLGELVDRITILELKLRHLDDPLRRTPLATELTLLTGILERSGHRPPDSATTPLREVNAALWHQENRIRALDRDGGPQAEFLATARAIHHLNDRRHALKRALSLAAGSALLEEKTYTSNGCSD
jgi:hypothetical protein